MFDRRFIVGGSLDAGGLTFGLPGGAPDPVDPNIPPVTLGLVANYDVLQQAGTFTGDGDPVSEIVDYANGNDAPLVSGETAATYVANTGASGTPGIMLAELSAFEAPAALKLNPAEPLTLILVSNRTRSNLTSGWITWTDAAFTRGYSLFQISGGQASARVGTGSTNNTGSDTWPVGRSIVDLNSPGAGGTFTLKRNRVPIGSGTAGSTVPQPSLRVLIGAADADGTVDLRLDGTIQQLLVYDRALNSTEMDALYDFLEARWSLI